MFRRLKVGDRVEAGQLLARLDNRLARDELAIKEAKLRTFVTPGQLLTLTASILHEGSGFAVTKAARIPPTCL